ncbi:putative non-specific polyamine oxidase [Lupinus albus]|uniref:Putative non-specific polyamine oxidase n=1 Tax=Lupinus albus TaxID=3870 RepID=A0A6A4Q807_LUPAL|nr:putative non-specific polyamine oxidase [Lupinus albus]
MVVKKPKIVIIGAGMAGLTAANKLHTVTGSKDMFELYVLFNTLMDHAQGKKLNDPVSDTEKSELYSYYHKLAAKASNLSATSVGSFLRQGLDDYWSSGSEKKQEELKGYGKWSKKLLEEGIFAMHENAQRTYTSAADLLSLDYRAESEYQMFPGDEITIAKGYLSIIESLASVLPPGTVQLGRKVTKIEWKPERKNHEPMNVDNGYCSRPVKLHFNDGSAMSADHVIITVSLGVLKAAIHDDSGMFYPPLPSFKSEAISRLGFGVVNKIFMQLSPTHERRNEHSKGLFPSLQMVFHSPQSEMRHKKIPWWMRRTATLCPIYNNSSVLLSWFAGKEALALESLRDEEIIQGVSTTLSSFLSHKFCNGNVNSEDKSQGYGVKFSKVLKTKWGTDPLFLGSYSYVAVGSSGDDLDAMAEPLPKDKPLASPPLQILFAGEATHRTHYSTTHGAYFSGLREANRLLQHYHCLGIYN